MPVCALPVASNALEPEIIGTKSMQNLFSNRKLRRILAVLVALVVAWLAVDREKFQETVSGDLPLPQAPSAASTSTDPASLNQQARALAEAFASKTSDLLVTGSGTVVRLLPDDNEGSRHQKFILAIEGGQTLLVSHNIDLAPRIDTLAKGDRIDFQGEYEWNDRGGVIHWTHHDPAGRHPGGWLKHQGRTYR